MEEQTERVEFYKKVHAEAIEFRRKKVKEILDKGKNASEMELSIIKQWANAYGAEAW